MSNIRIPCRCRKCSAIFDGYVFQTKQVVSKHRQNDRRHLLARALNVEIPQGPQYMNGVLANNAGNNQLPNEVFTNNAGNNFQLPNDPQMENLSDEDDFHNWDSLDEAHRPRSTSPAFDAPPVPALAPPPLPAHPPAEREIFNPAGPEPEPEPAQPALDGDEPQPLGIPAMQEEPYIRMAYLQAVMGNVFGKLTWDHATQQLNNTLDILKIADRLPEHPRPVRTLQSARRRLGIDPDLHIVQYSICPICWKHHTPQEFKDLVTPSCSTRNCKRMYNNYRALQKMYRATQYYGDGILIMANDVTLQVTSTKISI